MNRILPAPTQQSVQFQVDSDVIVISWSLCVSIDVFSIRASTLSRFSPHVSFDGASSYVFFKILTMTYG